jgi:sirohydrochlorin ferrochelatase
VGRKGSTDVDAMTASAMAVYARWCGATLARVHARSGDRIAIASYLLTSDVFDKAIADFSAAHADQNEREYQTLRDAVRSGRITAQTGLEPEADSIANARHLAPAAANHVPKKTPSTSMNRPGVSGDSEPWEGWSHARRYAQAVPA